MDLRAILTEDKDNQRSGSIQTPATPVTPVQQGLPQRGSREYVSIQNQHVSQGFSHQEYPNTSTPGRQTSHPPQQYFGSTGSLSGGQGQGPYASPIQYQSQPHPPPPLQVPTNADLRSPAGSYSAQSPYRQTPTSSRSSNQYPFPPHNPAPQSPAQQPNQYSSSFQSQPSQQSFSVPQTPPIGVPGSTHSYLQYQRSQSSVSSNTPTSAHSQPPYFNQPVTPNAPPSERHSGSERERSISVSPKTQPTKRKMGDVMNSPRDNVARKTSKSQPNGDVVAKSKPRPKYYPTPPIWAQSARTQRAGLTTLARPAGNAQAQLGPSPSIKQEPQTNGNGHPASSPDKFTKYILGGSRPQQQITKNVADWIFYNVVNRDDAGDLMRYGVELEIEAKLGEVIDVNTNLRYELPTATECLLREKVRVGFKSSMEPIHHRRLNDYLNEQVKFTHPMNPAAQKENRVELKHSHSKQIDKSYDLPPTTYNILPPSLVHYARHAKLRITYDKATNAVVATIIKGRIADLHICNPQSALDCRISISFEMKYEGDISQIVAAKANTGQPDRDKDRHSYALPHYQVDQTVATKVINGQPVHDIEGGSFEVEIELLTAAIKENGTRAKEGQPNIYVELVEGLLDNYRLLARAAGAPMG